MIELTETAAFWYFLAQNLAKTRGRQNARLAKKLNAAQEGHWEKAFITVPFKDAEIIHIFRAYIDTTP